MAPTGYRTLTSTINWFSSDTNVSTVHLSKIYNAIKLPPTGAAQPWFSKLGGGGGGVFRKPFLGLSKNWRIAQKISEPQKDICQQLWGKNWKNPEHKLLQKLENKIKYLFETNHP